MAKRIVIFLGVAYLIYLAAHNYDEIIVTLTRLGHDLKNTVTDLPGFVWIIAGILAAVGAIWLIIKWGQSLQFHRERRRRNKEIRPGTQPGL